MRENIVKNTRTRIKRIAWIGFSSALAILLSYVEFLLPPLFVAIPGIKLGLPNVIILFVLYSIDLKHAAMVSFVRLFISAMLFGNTVTLAYSVAGAILSLTFMAILKRTKLFSTVGVSVAGGVTHNLGQILVAMILLDTPKIAFYMIALAISGTVSGILVGLCGAILLSRIPKKLLIS